nr:DMT family transporter [Candidatus Sigynarchaeota archaeon]
MNERLKGYVLCLLAVISWSLSEITVKLLQGGVGPITLSFYRFIFGGLIVLALLVMLRKTKGTKSLLVKNKGLFFLSSVIAFGISNMIYFVGIQFTYANVGAAIYTTYTLFITIYGIFILNERTNIPLKIVGCIIGFSGAAILITNFNLTLFLEPDKILGNMLLLLAAAVWGFYSVLGKKIFINNPGIPDVQLKFTALSNLLAAVPIVVVLPFTAEVSDFFQHTPTEWGLVLFLGFVLTGLSLFIFFVGLRWIEVSHGISMSLLKPVFATIFAFPILGEIPTPALLVSIPMVAVAVLLINRHDKTKISKSI